MKKPTAQSGQALLELLFAIAMIMFLITGFVSSMRVGIRNQAFSRNKSESVRIASEGIELMYACREDRGFDRLGECDEPTGVPITRTGYPTFTRTIDISQNYQGDSNMRYVTVTVEWTESARPAKTELTTVITNWK